MAQLRRVHGGDRIAEHEERDDGVGTADRVRAGHRGLISPW
jgi:hypothetical protein